MTTIEKATKAMQAAFDDALVEFECGPSGKIYGQVVSSSFQGQSDHDRVDAIYRALGRALDESEVVDFVLVLGLTPAERRSVDDDAA